MHTKLQTIRPKDHFMPSSDFVKIILLNVVNVEFTIRMAVRIRTTSAIVPVLLVRLPQRRLETRNGFLVITAKVLHHPDWHVLVIERCRATAMIGNRRRLVDIDDPPCFKDVLDEIGMRQLSNRALLRRSGISLLHCLEKMLLRPQPKHFVNLEEILDVFNVHGKSPFPTNLYNADYNSESSLSSSDYSGTFFLPDFMIHSKVTHRSADEGYVPLQIMEDSMRPILRFLPIKDDCSNKDLAITHGGGSATIKPENISADGGTKVIKPCVI